jgi:hypothetical protein
VFTNHGLTLNIVHYVVYRSAPVDLKDLVHEKIEKEVLEEEELDKLFLKNICGEIMDEMMDLGSDYDAVLPRNQSKKLNCRTGKNMKIYYFSR